MKFVIFVLIGLPVIISGKFPDSSHSDLFPLAIIHQNDFHARFDETNPAGGPCSIGEKCIGGYARTVHKVKELLHQHRDKNPIYLNAGDNFQGTLWYNVGRWNVTQQFLNMLKADAITIGNHEFDHDIAGLVPFMEALQSPVVAANIDDSLEPTMQGKYNKSTVIVRSGRKIGIIGVVLQSYDEMSNTEKLKFTNESVAVKAEAERLTEEGVDIIIVLSHCGYEVDKVIATNAGPLIDVIVGSHSHTFLFSGVSEGPDLPRGPYPTIVVQKETEHRVLIVQAGAYCKYVGDLMVYFDDAGKIVNYSGNPHYMGNNVKQDPEILKAILPWKEAIDVMGNEVIGSTDVQLEKGLCVVGECNLGNFFTDAIIDNYVNSNSTNGNYWSDVAIAFVNPGALRIPLDIGNITYSHLVSLSPFENKMQAFNIRGHVLREALEYSIETNIFLSVLSPQIFSTRNLLQVSGLKVVYNVTMPNGKRVQSVEVRCQKCDYPRFEELKPMESYRVVTLSFVANGGDGFHMFPNNKVDVEEGMTDLEILIKYVRKYSPITAAEEGRITVLE